MNLYKLITGVKFGTEDTIDSTREFIVAADSFHDAVSTLEKELSKRKIYFSFSIESCIRISPLIDFIQTK